MAFRIAARWLREPDNNIAGLPGSAVDEATLGALSIETEQETLTRAWDRKTKEWRDGANLSMYGLAEWLVWNWWRLRWEPTHEGRWREGWRDAHDLAGIGGGWLWPNVTVHTDGVHILFVAKPSQPASTELLNYTADHVSVIPAATFEDGIGRFVKSVLNRLDEWSIDNTDLHTMWGELTTERDDPELSSYRKLEACLGFDPDEAESETVERFLADGNALGEAAMTEIAADQPLSAQDLRREAQRAGFDTNPSNGVQTLAELQQDDRSRVPAWRIGVDAARCLRRVTNWGTGPVSDRQLAELYGVQERILKSPNRNARVAFALNENGDGRTVLRAKRTTGRRFELARLLADRLLADESDRLHPATHTHTYRQKMQRAFAGEFLCPIDSLTDHLKEDYSDDAKEEAANKFRVSPLTVTTLLVNNGLTDRDEIHDRSTLAT